MSSSACKSGLGLLVFIGLGAQAHAQVNTPAEGTQSFVDMGGITTTPGQTVGWVAQNSFNPAGTTVEQQIVACTILNAACTRGPGPVTLSLPQQPVVPLPGLSSAFFGFAGGNIDAATSAITSGPTVIAAPGPGQATAGVLAVAVDYQQLLVNYTGTLPAPVNVGIDMAFSLASNIFDTSSGVTGFYITSAAANVGVFDASTFQSSAPGFDTVLGWSEGAHAGTFFGAGSTVALQGTDFLPLVPNNAYIVGQSASTGIFLFGGNYDGLNIQFTAVADPIFTLDPTWAAENPQYASNITISQDFNRSPTPVPEPDSWALFAAALAGTGFALRRQKTGRILVRPA